ncbi:MAG: metallophosphoesterase [Haloarculaceae archaeon]
MITVVSDTHGTDDHRLRGRTLTAVREAELVVHAGDFTTAAVLDAFETEADRLLAVAGNSDRAAVRERLGETAVGEASDCRVAVVHGHRHDRTALSLLGRQAEADVVVVGHSHRPGVERLDDVTLLNPGSHADPRGHTAAHAELAPDESRGRLVTPDGDVLESFSLFA